jgi:hypothetical protein
MAGPGDPTAADAVGPGHLRASRADREHVIDTLKTAFAQGRLTKDEMVTRVGQTFDSRTCAELAALIADIPAGPIGARTPRKLARVHTQPLMKKVAISCAIGSVAPVILVIALLTHNEQLASLFWTPALLTFLGLIVAVAQILDSRHQNRTRGQPSPRPGQRSQVLEREQADGTGDDLIRSEVRTDARTRHVPTGHQWRRPGLQLCHIRGLHRVISVNGENDPM